MPYLIGEHENSFHGESSRAEIEEILERWSKKVHDENVVVLLLGIVSYVWDADAALQDLVQFRFVEQLRMTCLDGFEFDGYFFAIGDVDAEIDIAERSRTYLAYETIFCADEEFIFGREMEGGACCWCCEVHR